MNIQDIIKRYQPDLTLENASTPPSAWYTEPGIAVLENEQVFANNWLIAARVEQLAEPGQYVTREIAGQPIVFGAR